jgi:aryl-alcohol dehydrogenase-like predicted oxidoreductase
MTLTQMALSFVNDRPFVTSNIIGATSLEQLKENIGTASIKLSSEVLKVIDEIQELVPNPAP